MTTRAATEAVVQLQKGHLEVLRPEQSTTCELVLWSGSMLIFFANVLRPSRRADVDNRRRLIGFGMSMISLDRHNMIMH